MPSVASRTLGARSIILNGKTGYLVDIDDAKQLSEKVMVLLKSETLRRKLGAAARKHVMANYKSTENIQKFVDFWRKVAKL